MQNQVFEGSVERIFFTNPDSPFTTGLLSLKEGGSARFAGSCYVRAGDAVTITGRWDEHPRFGRQIKVESAEAKMPTSVSGLARIIADDPDIVGVGAARAEKILAAAKSIERSEGFADPIDAIVERPVEVAELAGVKVKLVEVCGTALDNRRGSVTVLAALVEMGWSGGQAKQLLDAYSSNAVALAKDNPYSFIGKIARFGFRTVDAVATKMGFSKAHPFRISAGICYCLDEMGMQGHTFISRESLIANAYEELRPDSFEGEALIERSTDELIETGLVMRDHHQDGSEILALGSIAKNEIGVFSRLRQWLVEEMPEPMVLYESDVTSSLNEGQDRALRGIAHTRASVISGGAGVGKTYLMRAVAEVAEENGLRVRLCAPTGKAARKLESSSGRMASTIHRLLEPAYHPQKGGFWFTRDEGNPIEADLVIVDEASMIDVRLMSSLMRAIPDGCRLLLVGDHNQIPSVGAGAILRDILKMETDFPRSIHILTDIVRQAGSLARNTSAILRGEVASDVPPVWGIMGIDRGAEDGSAAEVAKLVEWASTNEVAAFGRPIDPMTELQVISPMKKGPLGTRRLNVEIQRVRQRLLGNPPPEPTPDDRQPKPLVGDRVIWTKNDYELDLLNGTQGRIVSFNKGGSVTIEVDGGRTVEIEAAKRANIEVAYAITIHKSQGSEWPMVVMCASSTHYIMHDRNLLYTGASRAATSLIFVGDWRGIRSFANGSRSVSRRTLGSLWATGWRPAAHEDLIDHELLL